MENYDFSFLSLKRFGNMTIIEALHFCLFFPFFPSIADATLYLKAVLPHKQIVTYIYMYIYI